MKEYVHDIPGRLRIRSAAIKRNDTGAAAARVFVGGIAGVHSVEANTLTGSLKIVYDPALVRSSELLQSLRSQRMLSAAVPSPSASNPMRKRAAARLAQYVLEAAVEKSVIALVGALL